MSEGSIGGYDKQRPSALGVISTAGQKRLVCAECGAVSSGRFCSSCGAEFSAQDPSGLFTGFWRSIPGVYLSILRSPIKRTVALADDASYRGHIGFALAGLAIYSGFYAPILLRSAQLDPPNAPAVMLFAKIIAQASYYVAFVISFIFLYAVFNLIANHRRFSDYVKVWCLAFGFAAPLLVAKEYLMATVGWQPSSPLGNSIPPTALQMSGIWLAATLSLLCGLYVLCVHARFWRVPVWKAGPLIVVASLATYFVGYWLMYRFGYYGGELLNWFGLLVPRA